MVRENGECNLELVYLTAFSAQVDHKPRLLLKRLHDILADETLTGNQRVTWLIALTYTECVAVPRPQLLRGTRHLKEAMNVAEDEDYRFWALQELAVRYGAVGNTKRLNRLLDESGRQFTKPEQVAAMNSWREKVTEYATVMQQRAARQAVVSQASHIRELERRLKNAREAGDDEAAARWQRLLSSQPDNG